MAGNPLISQGTLNRLIASIVVPNFPSLNVTPSYLGKTGITMSFGGGATTMIDTMTGMVTSPEPYIPVTIGIALLRTQGLGLVWRTQLESNSAIGTVNVIPDSNVWTKYPIQNVGITDQRDLSFAGDDPVFMVSLVGTYYINNLLWSA